MVSKSKTKVSYVCQECGYDTPAFLGKCPECGNWNSFKEITVSKENAGIDLSKDEDLTPVKLGEVSLKTKERISSGSREVDTVLGGGLVSGGVILLAGDPGVGKSTLLLQLALNIATGEKGKQEINRTSDSVLYISGEESVEQIKMRSIRLNPSKKSLEKLVLLSSTNIDQAARIIEKELPSFIVVDSIQTMQSQNAGGLAGSVSQVRYSTLQLVRIAKLFHIPVVIVGHVTKEGMVAGPMILSHMVDTVLFLEGEKFSKTRVLRSFKNRFGAVDEVGIFLMEEDGMHEVTSPEQLFLTNYERNVPGTVLVVTMEGSRAFLVELQALVVSSRLPLPRRVVSGIDSKRLELLLAVLQKHCRLPVDSMDVFVNVAGGMKVSDPGIDLGICLAVFSSVKNVGLNKAVGIGEVGLLGEVRNVPGMDKREKEAKQLGFRNVITAKKSKSLRDILESLG